MLFQPHGSQDDVSTGLSFGSMTLSSLPSSHLSAVDDPSSLASASLTAASITSLGGANLSWGHRILQVPLTSIQELCGEQLLPMGVVVHEMDIHSPATRYSDNIWVETFEC
jgi:hypothetical protein